VIVRKSYDPKIKVIYNPVDNSLILKKAQEAVLGGYKFCLDNDFSKALVKFNLAKDLFIKAGNFIEANTICQHFIAYCLYNTDKKTESIKLFTQVDEFCKKKSYKWLYLMNLYWFIGWNHGSSDYKSITKVKEDYERGFDIS